MLKEEYARRVAEITNSDSTTYNRVPNIFDLYINHNIKANKENRLSDVIPTESIIGTLIGTQFAGSDTSQASSNSGLTFLAELPLVQQRIYKEVIQLEKDRTPHEAIIDSVTMEK